VDGSAQRGEGGPETPSWADVRQAAMTQVERCAAALARLSLRGDRPVLAELHTQNVLLRDLCAQLTELHDQEFSEAVAELDRARAAAEALTAAGIPTPRPHPDLRVVS